MHRKLKTLNFVPVNKHNLKVVRTDHMNVSVCCEDVTRWAGSVEAVLVPPSNDIISNNGSS